MIAAVSFLLSEAHPSFDALVVSIIFGMLISNMLVNREQLQKGIDAMLRYALPVGIALYGTQLTFGNTVEYKTWLSVILLFSVSFAITALAARLFRLPERLSILLASGFAICGASAIAVISPLIGARKEDTSISIISIMVVGLVSMVFYPLFWKDTGLTFKEFAFFSGTTIPMLGQVKVAVLEGGAAGISMAVGFKLIRVSMLLFIVVAMLIVYGRKQKGSSVPWFMVVFVLLVVLVNLEARMSSLARIFEPASRFFLSSALAAIGLSVDFDSVTIEGAKPLYVVFLSWVAVSLIIFVGLRIYHV